MSRIDWSETSMRCFRSDHNIGRLINGARIAADEKHGENSIEAKPSSDVGFWLSCLVEEVGEVAHTLTYDGQADGESREQALANELLDVLAVAAAWLDCLRVEHRILPKHGVWLA